MNNDLISRKALKKAIKDSGYSHYFEDFFLTKLCEIIDNAPTVDLTKNQAYDKGFITAMKLYARPKGKWKKVKEERCSVDMSGEIATRYKCSICGRTITILPSKLADYPFCHCGADMRKGGVEE